VVHRAADRTRKDRERFAADDRPRPHVEDAVLGEQRGPLGGLTSVHVYAVSGKEISDLVTILTRRCHATSIAHRPQPGIQHEAPFLQPGSS